MPTPPLQHGGIWYNGCHLNPTSGTRRLVSSADPPTPSLLIINLFCRSTMDSRKRVLPLHEGRKLAFRSTDRGFTTKVVMLDTHCNNIFVAQMSSSLSTCCNGPHIRCYMVAAVTSGVSPFAVNGLAKCQHDDPMSTCLHV